MINRVVLTGRLTKEVELRYTPNGVAVATFTLAVNRAFANQNGEREADFINVVVWRKPAENCANFLNKGSLAGVDGRLQSRSYEGQDGKRVYVTEVVADSVQFLESRGQNNGGNGAGGTNTPNTQQTPQTGNQGPQNPNTYNPPPQQRREDPFANTGQPIDISDDDLPF